MAQKKTQIDELGGSRTNMKANSVEEELEHLAKLVAEAESWELILGQKETTSPVGEVCLASFMIIMMLSWVSRWMYRFVEV